jgi:hypothetical protein
MIRGILIDIALFLTPFVLYAAFLFATRAGVLHPESWPLRVLISLTLTALVLLFASSIYLAQRSGAPAGSDYVPPHMENGKLVPGQIKR